MCVNIHVHYEHMHKHTYPQYMYCKRMDQFWDPHVFSEGLTGGAALAEVGSVGGDDEEDPGADWGWNNIDQSPEDWVRNPRP